MEIRARYLLVGVFLLAVVAAGFGFVYWLSHAGGFTTRETYLVRFDAPVSGLVPGSAVLFNGIRVGEVTGLTISRDQPGQTFATIAIDASTPLRTDTGVGLDFHGLTGVASIALTGGAAGAPPLAKSQNGPPLLVADPAASADLTGAARTALQHLDGILTDNADSLHATIGNLSTFSDVLARNSGRVDSILQGLERLTGGGAKPPPPLAYDLAAATGFPEGDKVPAGQTVVLPPEVPLALDTQRILGEADGALNPLFDGTQWGDTIPLLVQARIVESFENAHYPRISRPLDGVSPDYQLLLAIRKFQISSGADAKAEVEIGAKILDRDGKILASDQFQASTPYDGGGAKSATTAIGQAFGDVAKRLVVWALRANPA